MRVQADVDGRANGGGEPRARARRAVIIAVLVASLAALGACGGGDDGADEGSGPTTTEDADRSTTTEAGDRPTTTERTTTTRPGTTTTTAAVKETTTTAPPEASSTTAPGGSAAGPAEHVRLPSGNIGCYLTPTEVRCDIAERSWEPPPAPPDCELDWGQGLILDARTTSFVCAGDTVLGADRVLEYGDAIEVGPFQCSSAPTGVTCRDVRDGHGFSLARGGYEQF